MYFKNFPTLLYSLDNFTSMQLTTDILRRVLLREEVKNLTLIYDPYDVKEGETPEILAHKVYGDTELHWIILHTNDILDPRFDWPMDDAVLVKYVKEKYGIYSDQIYNAEEGLPYHHKEIVINEGTENEEWIITDEIPNYYTADQIRNVSFYEHENRINEAKRQIKLLQPKYVSMISDELTALIKQ